MKRFLLFVCLLPFSLSLFSQQSCACCTPEHSGFDFWVGEWEVFNPDGTKAGENTIEYLEDKCIVSERWVGVSGTTGRSFNHYDASDGSWNQLWLDNKGTILKLKGTALPGKMVLKTALITYTDGTKYYSQVTWTQNEDGTVRQLWEYYKENGSLLSVAFDGLYKPKS